MDLANRENLIEYLKKNGLWAKKGLSQNFLVDRKALDTIIEAAEIKPPLTPPSKGGEVNGDLVIEIGPGVGTLTQEFVKHADEVIAIELDKKLAELLKQSLCHPEPMPTGRQVDSGSICIDSGSRASVRNDKGCGLTIVNEDVLKVNLDELIGDKPYKVVANIPYAITSKILELFLSREHKPELMVLLVQKEVAERVAAKPGDMSVLSVSVQLYGKPEIAGIVPAESFFPAPKVDSAILKIVTSDKLQVTSQDEKELFRLVHIGFSSRRKTLINNLSAGYRISKEKAFDIIKQAGFKETVRAQEMSVENWLELLQIIQDINSKH